MVKNTKIIWHEILLYENFWHEKKSIYVVLLCFRDGLNNQGSIAGDKEH